MSYQYNQYQPEMQYSGANGYNAYNQPSYVTNFQPSQQMQYSPAYNPTPQYIGKPYVEEQPHGCCKRGCCCCCIYSTSGKWICAIVSLIFVAGLAVAGYFLWPRIPTISNTSIALASIPNPVTVTGALTSPTFVANFTATADVYNPNYITYKTSEITLTGSYVQSDGTVVPAGQGVLLNQNFPAFSTTKINVPYNLQYTAQGINDPVLTDLLKQCGIYGSTTTSPLKFQYQLQVVLIPFNFIRIPISGSTQVECPQQLVKTAIVNWLNQNGITIPGING